MQTRESVFPQLDIELKKHIFQHLSLFDVNNMRCSTQFFYSDGAAKEIFTQKLIEFFTPIQKTTCDFLNHCLYVTKGGWVASIGGHHGRFGLGEMNEKTSTTFVKVLFPHKIMKASLGRDHVVFLDDAGGVWVAGNNVKGQLGLGKNILKTTQPVALAMPSRIVDILAGAGFTLLQDSESRFFLCGENHLFLLGINHNLFFNPALIDMGNTNMAALEFHTKKTEMISDACILACIPEQYHRLLEQKSRPEREKQQCPL